MVQKGKTDKNHIMGGRREEKKKIGLERKETLNHRDYVQEARDGAANPKRHLLARYKALWASTCVMTVIGWNPGKH